MKLEENENETKMEDDKENDSENNRIIGYATVAKIGMETKDDLVHLSYGFYSIGLTELARLRNTSQHNRDDDFCTKWWTLVSSLSCGACCRCWCMCCDICDLAPENR